MIKKRYIFIPLVVLSIGVLVIGAIGYILFFRQADGHEVVFAATEVGAPEGPAATKNIGPSGGTLESPDGRLTLTVPQNALTETVPFSIQPVTDKFEAGLGSSYRLEPSGMTFDTPLDISVHYDDHDLESTIPEALSLAYQDKDGAWHAQNGIDLNKGTKTITFSATHFSDYALIWRLRLLPAKATLHPGESVKILPTDCAPVGVFWNALHYIAGMSEICGDGWGYDSDWKLVGEGKLTQDWPRLIYTAPGKKPTPNVATVVLYNPKAMLPIPRPCTERDGYVSGKNSEKWILRTRCYNFVPGQSVESVITIVDWGYKVSGQDGPVSYSGVVCDLDRPFSVTTTMGPLTFPTKFEPHDAASGIATWGATYYARGAGSGPYSVTEDGSGYKITLHMASSVSLAGRTAGGSGDAHIVLTPLEGNECSGK
jgi:hypothetical protein